YKPEFKQSRASKFDFVRFISEDDHNLNKIDSIAKSQARALNPVIRGGEFVDDDFKSLIDLLKLNMICTWDNSSSVYYLTMKMLGQPNTPEYEKYSELSASIYNELSDFGNTRGHWSTDVKLVSSSGHEFTEEEFRKARENKSGGMGGMTKALEMFIASLNWLAYKSIYYSIAAKHFKADSFIHPIRHAYQLHWMRKTGSFGHDYTAKIIQNLSCKVSSTASEIIDHGRASTLSLDLPIVSAWLTAESGGVKNVIYSALEIKNQDPFTVVREVFREIHACLLYTSPSPRDSANYLVCRLLP
ncbi:hypothetical protein, partial [Chromobacterium sp. ASV23]|uniref:hypothetical protein n=1 Tax=Chromobacterium sp. ASV23 TaxID=2795110 RepID=UPI0018EA58AF